MRSVLVKGKTGFTEIQIVVPHLVDGKGFVLGLKATSILMKIWLKALVNIVFSFKNLSCMSVHATEYLMGCKNEPVKKIIFQGYHLVLQKSENLKDHPIDQSTGVIIIVNNNYNFHRYLDNESVSFIIFAFLDVFSSI